MVSLILTKTPTQSLKTLIRLISIFPQLAQQPQPQLPPSSFSRNPSSGSPFYHQNWRNLNPTASASSTSLVPVGFNPRSAALSQTLDAASLSDVFADYMASQRWGDLKELFEFWIRSLDASGKPNRPDVGLFNHYLRANLMMGATAGELLDMVAQMEEYEIRGDTASFNLVLKAMHQARESEAAEKLIERQLTRINPCVQAG